MQNNTPHGSNTVHSAVYCKITRNFLDEEFVIGEKRELELYKKIYNTIDVNDLNEAFNDWFRYDDRLINFRYPKKNINFISKEDFLSIENKIKNTKLAQFEFSFDEKQLIEKKLVAAKIKSQKKHLSIDALELNLENGVKVFLKKTKYYCQRDLV